MSVGVWKEHIVVKMNMVYIVRGYSVVVMVMIVIMKERVVTWNQ